MVTTAARKGNGKAANSSNGARHRSNGNNNGNGKAAAKSAAKAKTGGSNGNGKTQPAGSASKPAPAPSPAKNRREWLGLDSGEAMNAASLPTLPLEAFEVAPTPADAFEDSSGGSTTVGWIGIGQAGGRIARAFHGLGYGKSFVVNTCPHDLEGLDMAGRQKLLLDIGYEASGKDPMRGEKAAEQYRQQILYTMEHVFGQGVDHVMLAVGAGGGMGGATPAVIDAVRAAAKRIGIRRAKKKVGVVCTLPTHGEAASPRLRDNAHQLVSQLSELARQRLVSPLIILDNEKVQRLYPNMTVKQFWPSVNETAAGLFHIFNRLSALPSPYTCFDPDDYRSLMQAGGCSVMGLTKVDPYIGRNDLADALRKDLDKTLLADGFDLRTAKQVGAIVVGGKKIMAERAGLQDVINRAFDVMTDLTGRATVHRGIYEDDKDSVRVYTMISGLEPPMQRLEELAEME